MGVGRLLALIPGRASCAWAVLTDVGRVVMDELDGLPIPAVQACELIEVQGV